MIGFIPNMTIKIFCSSINFKKIWIIFKSLVEYHLDVQIEVSNFFKQNSEQKKFEI